MKREGMADVPGARRIKNRGLEWTEFSPGNSDVPPLVASEISNIMSDFESKFQENSDGQTGVRMIWAYSTNDASIQSKHKQAIETSNDPRKDQFLQLISWMDKYGARLFMSPNAIARYRQQSGQNVQESTNTSEKWLEQFGYIWGLGKVGNYRNKRDAHDVSDEHAEMIKNDPKKIEEMKAADQKLLTVVTAPTNGAYGIYFSDGHNLTPVIGNDYYASSKTNHTNRNWVDWDTFRSESGQHSKYFGVTSKEGIDVKKTLVYPTSTQFFLAEGEQDPKPQVISKADLKSSVAEKTEYTWNGAVVPSQEITKSGRGSYIWNKSDGTSVNIPAKELQIKEQTVYYLWIKNDGTLWWVPKSLRNEIAGKERKGKIDSSESGKPVPLTREQVDFFNLFNGKHVRVTKPDTHVYSWDSLTEGTPEEKSDKQLKIQDYHQKTQLMDDLYDFFESRPGVESPDVRLQATKYVIIGPQFKKAQNTGVQETVGRMKSHHTHLQDMTPGSNEHFATRKGWVVVGGEFNSARAEARGEKGIAPAQSIDGLGPMTTYATVYDAISHAFSSWKINCSPPDSSSLQSAQAIFNKTHGMVANAPKKQNAIPGMAPTIQPSTLPRVTPQPITQNKPQLSQPAEQVSIMPKQNEEFLMASRKQHMLKDTSQIIRNFKRLG